MTNCTLKGEGPASEVLELRSGRSEQVEDFGPLVRVQASSIVAGLRRFHACQQTAGITCDGSVITAHSQFTHTHTRSGTR